MKSVVADYRYRTHCLRIVPVSGPIIRLTNHVCDLLIGAETYISGSGYQFSGFGSTSDFSPASIDIEGVVAIAGITRATIASGLFDGARCYIFATSWKAPVEDQEPILAGMFGKTELLDDSYVIRGLSLVDVLGQTVGETYSPQCPKTFGSTGFAGCKVPLAPNTVTGTLTHVTSASAFRDSARTEPDDTFGAGTIRFTSGPNAGLKPLEVRSYGADGSVTTFEPFYYLPAVGDAYELIRGCRKRLIDCQNRWDGAPLNNIENFGGFPYIPAGTAYAQVGQGGGA